MANAPQSSDIPGVIVFPPLIPLTVVVLGGLCDGLFPLGLLASIPLPLRLVVGAALLGVGLAIGLNGLATLRRVGTNVRPTQPALVLARQGAFAHCRNPIYVGMSLALAGLLVALALDWTLVLLVASMPVMHYGVVLREERYLERRFGDDYRRYLAEVPRYGWRWQPAA